MQRDVDELTSHLQLAGLEPIDAWEDRRRPVRPVDRHLARIGAVAGHLSAGLDEDLVERLNARIAEELTRAAGPKGLRFTMVRLFGVARRP